MPELPEVETTRRGIEPWVTDRKIEGIILRRGDLRQPVSPGIADLVGNRITAVRRRSKYLLCDLADRQVLMIHLGMSGSLRICAAAEDWRKHDHLALVMDGGNELRFHDPRRFGLVLLLAQGEEENHPLLKKLGPEPLGEHFSPANLHAGLARRGIAVKFAIMDATLVVGVGNIYASEALFRAGIDPRLAASRVSRPRAARLHAAIREVLELAIEVGGTTLRDFLNSDGQPGYFRQQLMVYGRGGEPCRVCSSIIRQAVLGQRSTFWCPRCQKR